MRDINKYLLAPIGENGSRPETNHIPIHSMTFFAQTVKYSKCDEYIVLHQMREWWILNLFGLIKLNTFDRICEIGYWSLKCISVLEAIGFAAIFLPFLENSHSLWNVSPFTPPVYANINVFYIFRHNTDPRVICVGALWGLVRAQRKLYNAAAKKISNLRIFLLPLNSTKGQLLLHQLFEELKTQKPNI